MAGLAFASAVSSTVYALLLLIPLERRGEGVLDNPFAADLLKMLAAAVLTGLCAWCVLCGLEQLLPGGKLSELASLCLCALAGVLVYFGAAFALGLPEAKLALLAVKRIGKRG